MNRVLRHIRRAALLNAGDGPADAQLLESFLTRRDEAAFEALLRRHGPMVLGVCRRVLRHAQDAEDAFQATFLVLARKAGSLRSRDLLGNWLYGVAHRTAMKARAMNAKRRAKERHARELPRPGAADGPSEELLARLDAELSRLPDKYRVSVVLCELQGRSRKEVAGRLHIPEGTLSSRLAYAKKLLARRLSRYGAAVSVGSLAAAISKDAVASVPASLLNTTAGAVLELAGGPSLAAGAVSARVVALTEGVMKAMLLSKLNLVSALVLAVVVGAGAVGLTYRPAEAQPAASNRAAPSARAAADELEELRLEVAALRKGLEVTHERVKALEEEVRTLRPAGWPPAGSHLRGTLSFPKSDVPTPPDNLNTDSTRPPQDDESPGPRTGSNKRMSTRRTQPLPENAGRNPFGAATDRPLQWTPDVTHQPSQPPADPLAQAEVAFKKLRINPGDRQATQALERALKELKARDAFRRTYPQGSGSDAPAKP